MTPEQAIKSVRKRFPFAGYMNADDGPYLNIVRTVLRYLQSGDKILDFGSGPCDKTAVLQALGFRCFACDDLSDDWHKIEANKDKILAFTRESGIEFRLADDSILPFDSNSFDMVMMHDVLEHLHDSPRDLLNDLIELIKPEGFLFITVPNAVNIRKRIHVLFGRTNLPDFTVYYWYPGPWRGHIREYTKGDLTKLAGYLNLEIVELRSCHHMLAKLPRIARPVYLGLTRIFTGWRDSWLLIARKKADWVPRRSLPENQLREILGETVSYQY